MEQSKSIEKKSILNITSMLCWALGIINLLSSIQIVIFKLLSRDLDSTETSIIRIRKLLISPLGVFTIKIFIIGIALCVAGCGLRKRKRYGGVIAIIIVLLTFIFPPIVGVPFIGLILATLIIFIVKNWKELS